MVTHSTSPKRVAIIGSGVTGLGALYALRNTPHEVHLYESADRLGGHTNTVAYKYNNRSVNVDTGFIVMNSATYPNFLRFLSDIDVLAVPTEMTFGVSRDAGAFEWAGTSLSAVFAQRANILNPRVWRMIFDIVRFNQFALDLLHTEDESEEDPNVHGLGEKSDEKGNPAARTTPRKEQESIGAYLKREGYSAAFRDDYLIPMTAAVWSTSPDKCSLDFPAVTLVRFMWNHHLLSTVAARPTWMTIKGGSRQYIDALLKEFPQERVHLNSMVKAVRSDEDGGKVRVRFEGRNEEEVFDHVLLACHGDTATEIVRRGNARKEELDILAGFKTSENVAYLHSDLSLMPRRRLAWSAWNYLTSTSSTTGSDIDQVCLTYDMNTLQHIPREDFGSVLVTLNPLHEPSPALTQGKWTYHHPLYTAEAIRSQKRLPRIQNTRGLSYAGAWTKYGFHEDGFSSGVKVACEALGGEIPWEFVDSTFSRGRRPTLGLLDWIVRAGVVYIGLWIWVLELIREVVSGKATKGKLA